MSRDGPASRLWIIYCLLKVCLGMAVSIFGPMVGHLAEQTHTTEADLGFLFAIGTVFEVSSAIMFGIVFDRLENQHLLVTAMGLVLSMSMFMIPFAPSKWTLAVAWGGSVVPRPFLASGTNMLLIWDVGKDCAGIMNFVTGAFGIGSIVAPQLAFLLTRYSSAHTVFWVISACSFVASLALFRFKCPKNPAKVAAAAAAASVSLEYPATKSDNNKTDVEYHDNNNDEHDDDHQLLAPPSSDSSPSSPFSSSTWHDWKLVLLCAAATGSSVSIEVSFGAWINTLARNYFEMGQTEAAALNSCYFAMFTTTRLILIPSLFKLIPKMKPSVTIVVSGCIAILGPVILFLFPNTITLWLCTFLLGTGIAPYVGTSIGQAQRWVNQNGLHQAAFSLAAAGGSGMGAFGASRVMATFGANVLIGYYIGLCALCIVAAVSILMVDIRIQQQQLQYSASINN